MVEDQIARWMFHKDFSMLDKHQLEEFYRRRVPIKINGHIVGFYILNTQGMVDHIVNSR